MLNLQITAGYLQKYLLESNDTLWLLTLTFQSAVYSAWKNLYVFAAYGELIFHLWPLVMFGVTVKWRELICYTNSMESEWNLALTCVNPPPRTRAHTHTNVTQCAILKVAE